MLSYKTLLKLFVDGACSLMKKKCKVVHYGHSNPNLDYYMNGVQLPKSTGERDLGVHMEQSLKPNKQCTEAKKKAKSSPYMLSRAFHFRDKKVFLRLYFQYVRSNLEFATPAWNSWNRETLTCWKRFMCVLI